MTNGGNRRKDDYKFLSRAGLKRVESLEGVMSIKKKTLRKMSIINRFDIDKYSSKKLANNAAQSFFVIQGASVAFILKIELNSFSK